MRSTSRFSHDSLPGDARASVLIADDEDFIRIFLSGSLRQCNCQTTEFDPCVSGVDTLRRHYDVALIDLMMPGMTGFDVSKVVLEHSPDAEIIFITGHPNAGSVSRVIDAGAGSFLIKPLHAEQVRCSVLGALHRRQRRRMTARQDRQETGGMIIGESKCIQQLLRRIGELAPLDVPILITGESGTGKELVAHNIHFRSRRADGPFVPVNCAGLAPSLIESELFGHVQGAFTGAYKTKHGFFEAAHGGTLFLDEVAELPVELQSKLLRVLDTGEFVRVGETQPRRCDVRIVSATNRDIAGMVEGGSFRKDLYYRLRGGHVHVDPLRNRREDIPLLVRHFLGGSCRVTLSAEALLCGFDWPGNVRELAMVSANVKGLCADGAVSGHLVSSLLETQLQGTQEDDQRTYQGAKEDVLREFEKHYFADLLARSGGNISRAAQTAGMHRKNLRDKLKQLGLYHREDPSSAGDSGCDDTTLVHECSTN